MQMHSALLHHIPSKTLSNAGMKVVAHIRRERLAQLKAELRLSYADMNELLGRSRRDATLSQIGNAAPNSRTGRPRQLGDDQARELERVFNKPMGWFDTDPAFDSDPNAQASQLTHAAEPVTRYNSWPFARISKSAIERLTPDQMLRLEDVILGALLLLNSSHHQAPATGTTG